LLLLDHHTSLKKINNSRESNISVVFGDETTSLKSKNKPLVYFSLPNEQFTTPQLLEYAAAAEKAGFDGVRTSDHFQPWQPNEERAGSAWILLAPLSAVTIVYSAKA
jgi:hypothetical protein